jgi:hypothetical protein
VHWRDIKNSDVENMNNSLMRTSCSCMLITLPHLACLSVDTMVNIACSPTPCDQMLQMPSTSHLARSPRASRLIMQTQYDRKVPGDQEQFLPTFIQPLHLFSTHEPLDVGWNGFLSATHLQHFTMLQLLLTNCLPVAVAAQVLSSIFRSRKQKT